MNLTRTFTCAALAMVSVNARAQGSIVGTVYDSLSTHAPLANATVVLVERSRYATTDERGRFRIDSVPAGRYTIGFMHPVLDSLDLTGPVVPVEVVGGRRTMVSLSTPGRAAGYARICRDAYEAETGVVIGRVRDVDDKSPLAEATVTTDWTEYTVVAGHAAGHRVRAAARTTRDGIYLLCGVPANVPLDVRTEFDGFSAGPTPLLLGDRLMGRIDFAVSRRDRATRAVTIDDSSSVVVAVPGSASLRGMVRGRDGRPVRDAVVHVVGTLRSGRTDGTGAFLVDHIPAGTRTIEVRSIGLLPMAVSMDFATDATRDTSLISVLQGLRGVTVEHGGSGKTGGMRFAIPYLLGVSDLNQMRCAPNFFLDGAPFSSSPGGFAELSSIVRPEAIKGIEVYSNPGTIPAQYDLTSSTGCGSIIIWTR